jgi:hypothetical protein
MPPGNPARLLKLADREFRQLTEDRSPPPPAPRRFKPGRLNATRFDQSWDRKRGSAARLMAVLLREDDAALHQRVCESDRAAKTYADAADWLQRESAYLRKVSRLLDMAAGRISVVLERCQSEHTSPSQGGKDVTEQPTA